MTVSGQHVVPDDGAHRAAHVDALAGFEQALQQPLPLNLQQALLAARDACWALLCGPAR